MKPRNIRDIITMVNCLKKDLEDALIEKAKAEAYIESYRSQIDFLEGILEEEQ